MKRVLVVHPTTFSRMSTLERAVSMGGKLTHVCEYSPPGVFIWMNQDAIDYMALGLCDLCGQPLDNAPLGVPQPPAGILTD